MKLKMTPTPEPSPNGKSFKFATFQMQIPSGFITLSFDQHEELCPSLQHHIAKVPPRVYDIS